jgi:hypothetical protein
LIFSTHQVADVLKDLLCIIRIPRMHHDFAHIPVAVQRPKSGERYNGATIIRAVIHRSLQFFGHGADNREGQAVKQDGFANGILITKELGSNFTA